MSTPIGSGLGSASNNNINNNMSGGRGNNKISSPGSSSSSPSASALAYMKDDQTEERARLDKTNLELKMKVFYLEDKIRRLPSTDSHSSTISSNNYSSSSSIISSSANKSNGNNSYRVEGGMAQLDNITSLRLALEEKDIIIDQKNNLLVKAKQIISQLESELDRLRLLEDVKTGLEDRLQRLKGANDDIENEYRRQIADLELQLNQMRHSSIAKEEARLALADKCSHLEIAQSELQEKYEVSRDENTRENERNNHLQQRNKDMDYELSQLRARCEIYEMQVCELTGELEKEKIALDARCREYDDISSKYSTLKERTEHTAQTEAVKMSELCAELREMLRKEQVEKAACMSRADQLALALESAKTAMKEQNTTLSFADEEVKRLSVDNIELNKKVNIIAEVSRDNERLKSTLASQSHELADATDKIKVLQDTLSDTRQELIIKSNSLISLDKSQIKLAAQETALDELRSLTVSLRHELDQERDQKVLMERGHLERIERLVEVANVCAMSCSSMEQWDGALDDVLDGDLFAPILNTIASTSLQQQVVVNSNDEKMIGKISNKRNLDWKKLILEDGADSEIRRVRGKGGNSSFDSNNITQHVASLVEGLQQKVKRITKIRALFVSQSQKMADIVMKQVVAAQQQATLTIHEVVEAQRRVDAIQTVVSRDKKHREDEIGDLRRFREEVIIDFSTRLRDTEHKLADAQREAEAESNLRAKACEERDRSSNQTVGLQNEVTQLKLDLSRYENYDSVVAEITSRFNEITENYRVLQKESEFKTEQIREMQQMNKDLNSERVAANLTVDSLKQQLRLVDEKLLESQNTVQVQLKEITHLKSRQIDPALLQTIQRTQAMMSSLPTPLRGGQVQTGTGAGLKTKNESRDDQQFRALLDIIAAVDELTKESQEVVKKFEMSCDNLLSFGHNNHNIEASASPNLNEIKDDIFELLDENSRLLTLLNQTASDIRRYFRRQDSQGGNGHITSIHQNRPSANFAQAIPNNRHNSNSTGDNTDNNTNNNNINANMNYLSNNGNYNNSNNNSNSNSNNSYSDINRRSTTNHNHHNHHIDNHQIDDISPPKYTPPDVSSGGQEAVVVSSRPSLVTTATSSGMVDSNINSYSNPDGSSSRIQEYGRRGSLYTRNNFDGGKNVTSPIANLNPSIVDNESAEEKDSARARQGVVAWDKEESLFTTIQPPLSLYPQNAQAPLNSSVSEVASPNPTPNSYRSSVMFSSNSDANHLHNVGKSDVDVASYADTQSRGEHLSFGISHSTALSMSQLRSSTGQQHQQPQYQRHSLSSASSSSSPTSNFHFSSGGGVSSNNNNSNNINKNSNSSSGAFNRLGRLGSDLNDLARKLDSFDASR